jgi:hypothetical protein
VDEMIGTVNTTLDLMSGDDLPVLAAFAAEGISSLHVAHGQEGLWDPTVETDESPAPPDSPIAALMAGIASLMAPRRTVESSGTRRA